MEIAIIGFTGDAMNKVYYASKTAFPAQSGCMVGLADLIPKFMRWH